MGRKPKRKKIKVPSLTELSQDGCVFEGDVMCHNGTDGKVINGEKFGDENFILKHIGLGILCMVSSGPNTNSFHLHCQGCVVLWQACDFWQNERWLEYVEILEHSGSRTGQR